MQLQEYYQEIAEEAGISYEHSSKLPEIKRALASGDEHLNNIPLAWWDVAGAQTRYQIYCVLRARDQGGVSLSDLVCTHKAAAKKAALGKTQDIVTKEGN